MYVCLKETTCVWVWLGKRHDLWKKAGHVNERNFELDFFCQKCFGMTLGHDLNRGRPFPKRGENAKMVLAWKWSIVVLPFGCCSICFLRQIHRVRHCRASLCWESATTIIVGWSKTFAMHRNVSQIWLQLEDWSDRARLLLTMTRLSLR